MIGNSVSKFFRWLSPNRKSRFKSLTETERPQSVSSEDSGLCPDSPLPLPSGSSSTGEITPDSLRQQFSSQPQPACDQQHTVLQQPSSSKLLTKRVLERLHKVQRPQALAPSHPTLAPAVSVEGTISNHSSDTEVPSEESSSSVRYLNLLVPASHSPLSSTLSCPTEPVKPSRSLSDKEKYAATWPPIGYQFIAGQ